MNVQKIQMPPNSVESEKALLGSLFFHQEIIKKVRKIVKPEYFYTTANRILCYAIFDLESKGSPVDILTVKVRLDAAKKLDEVGGMSYIAEVASCVPSASNAEEYARIVREKFKARKLLETSEEITRMVNDKGKADSNVKDVVKKMYDSFKEGSDHAEEIERLKEVAKLYNGDDKVVSFQEVYDKVKSEPEVPKVWTGHMKLDEILRGFRPKHLIVLSGVTKHGKTSFAVDMITRMKEQNPLLLAIEESVEELMEKFIERGEEAPVGYAPQNISFVDTDWVERKVVEGIVNFNSKIVFIDNLDWVSPMRIRPGQTDAKITEQTVRELKHLAKKWNVVVVLLVHLTKDSKADRNPTFEDFKGSSAISQIADKAFLIWRETERGDRGELVITNNANVSVQLNRQGGVGNVKMSYEGGHYVERDWKVEKEEDSFGDFSSKKLQYNKNF